MPNTRRPRVAAIGLDESQLASIAPLCGALRSADSLSDYLQGYDWTETDVLVSSSLWGDFIDCSTNLMTVGPIHLFWTDFVVESVPFRAQTDFKNTERELTVSSDCPDLYRSLARELSRDLGNACEPPDVVVTSREDLSALITTTSARPVALRVDLPARSTIENDEPSSPVALLLPEIPNLSAWFRAFLFDIHESDPERVPHAPPRLSQPADWYTPQESALARRVSLVESEIERLRNELAQLRTELDAEGERANSGIRRILWADGDELVAAAEQVLSHLGFEVRNMDAVQSQGEPKREDLRLTLPDCTGWEALVEVKGYTSGTRTNDARQIREHRDRYIAEEGRPPNLTMWLANPFRTLDPSSRSAPDKNVEGAAEIASAVHVQASDLYRQWTLVAAGRLETETVVQSLVTADPGLWTPQAKSSGA